MSVLGAKLISMTTTKSPPPYITVSSLDFYRGVMPVIVFLSHAAIWTGCVKQLHVVVVAGGLAVDVFIFISGFLMLWHYLDRELSEPWNVSQTWLLFWLRRLFRLAPLYWFLLILVFGFLPQWTDWSEEFYHAFQLPWHDGIWDPNRVDSSRSLGNVLSHFSFVFGVIPKFASNNPLPDWSIGLEMQFYLAFPFLALGIQRFGWRLIVLGCVIIWIICLKQIHVGLLATPGPWGWFPMATFLPLRIGGFVSGMLIAHALARNTPNRFALAAILASLALAGWHNKYLIAPVLAFVLWEWINRKAVWPEWLNQSVNLATSFLQTKPVQFIADCSYGVYLWHMLVLLACMRWLVDLGLYRGRTPLERFGILVVIALPLIYLIAWLSFHWIERPGIRLGKAVIKRIRKLQPTPCTADSNT